MNTTTDERKTFCSSKGVTLMLRPVSQFKLDNLRASAREIPIPQYEMKVAGGATVLHPMDETIARNQNRMDEWNAYIQQVQAEATRQSRLFTELVLFEGVEVDVPDQDSEWQKQMEHFGINIPNEPIARKLQYIYNEFLVGGEDIVALISQILSVSQIDEEAVSKIRDSFRLAQKRNPAGSVAKSKRKMAE